MGKKLYVGNLTDSVSSMDLQEWFTPFGAVQSAQVMTDRETGCSRGFDENPRCSLNRQTNLLKYNTSE